MALPNREQLRELWEKFITWFNNGWLPKVIAAFTVIVIVDLGVLFGFAVGVFDAVTTKESKLMGIEVTSQIVNGMFTGLVLYMHPSRIYQTYLLITNFPKLQAFRNYDGLTKKQLQDILICQHVNSLAQYMLTYFMWFYAPLKRPPFGVLIPLIIAVTSGFTGAILEGKYIYKARTTVSQAEREEKDSELVAIKSSASLTSEAKEEQTLHGVTSYVTIDLEDNKNISRK